MGKVFRFLLIVIFILLGCSSRSYYTKDEEKFYKYLAKNYREYADFKTKNNDWYGAELFYKKADIIDKGYIMMPEYVSNTSNLYNFIFKYADYAQLHAMRDRMYLVLNNNLGKAQYPEELANLQFFYDCWTLEEGAYTKYSQLVRCRGNFLLTLEYLEFKLFRYTKEEREFKDEPPPPPPREKKYIIYFDFDSSMVNEEATLVLWELLNDISALNTPYIINILGHADRMGTKSYNVKLSKRRSDTIKHYLVKNGIPPENIKTNWNGEIDPQVLTDNQFKEQLNRRVTITLEFPDYYNNFKDGKN